MEKMLEQYYLGEEGYDLITNDLGFCAYRTDENGNFYIGHVFMPKEKRKESDKFFNQVRFRVKALNCKRIVGDLFVNKYNAENYTRKVTIFLLNGFEIIDVNDKCITIMKEI